MPIGRGELEARTERLRRKMRDEGLDALVIFSDEYRSGHATYLTSYKPLHDLAGGGYRIEVVVHITERASIR